MCRSRSFGGRNSLFLRLNTDPLNDPGISLLVSKLVPFFVQNCFLLNTEKFHGHPAQMRQFLAVDLLQPAIFRSGAIHPIPNKPGQ